jgi:MFS family permease
MMSYVTLAWLVKPLWGYLIDRFGSKGLWIQLSTALGIGLCLFLMLGPFDVSTLWLLVAVMALLNWTMAIRDVATDGIACVEGKRHGCTGKFQSIQWGSVTFASMLGSLGGGWLATNLGWQWGYGFIIPFLLGGLYVALKIPNDAGLAEKSRINFSQYRALVGQKYLQIILFVWLFNTAPSFSAPLFYKQRDTFHWTPMIIAYLGGFSALLSIVGAGLYAKYGHRLPMKKILVGGILFFAPATLLYLHYTPITAWVYTGIFNTIGMIVFLVCMDMMAKNSIAGMESTSFALLCSVANFGSWCSAQMGSYCLEWWGLTATIFINAAFGLLALAVVPFIKWDDQHKV